MEGRNDCNEEYCWDIDAYDDKQRVIVMDVDIVVVSGFMMEGRLNVCVMDVDVDAKLYVRDFD